MAAIWLATSRRWPARQRDHCDRRHFVLGGVGEGAVLGDSGNDQQAVRPVTSSSVTATASSEDHNSPGHDALIGGNQDDKYEEGGDDIVVAGDGREVHRRVRVRLMRLRRSATAERQPEGADLDRWSRTSSRRWRLYRGNANDILRGDDSFRLPSWSLGQRRRDALDAGVARIAGLDALVPASIRRLTRLPSSRPR